MPALAGVVGVSPSIIEQDILRGERVPIQFMISRSNPNEDEWLDVSVEGEETEAFDFPTRRLFLPLGVSQVEFSGYVDTSMVSGQEDFEGWVLFLQEMEQTSVGGSAVRVGAKVQVLLHLLDEETMKQKGISFDPAVHGSAFVIDSLVFDRSTGELHVTVTNTSADIVSLLPYKVSFTSTNGSGQSFMSTFSGPISAGETQTFLMDDFQGDPQEVESIVVKIGENEKEQGFYTGSLVPASWIESDFFWILLSGFVLMVLCVVKKTRKVLLTCVRALKKHRTKISLLVGMGIVVGGAFWGLSHRPVSVSSAQMQDLPTFFLTTTTQQSTIVHSSIEEPQILYGSWTFVPVRDTALVALPQDDTAVEEYANSGYLFHERVIQPFSLDELPGSIEHVDVTDQGTYLLLASKDSEGASHWCLKELDVSSESPCVFLDNVVSQIVDILPTVDVSNHLRIETTHGWYLYDIWLGTVKPTESEAEEARKEEGELFNVSLAEPVGSMLGIAFLKNGWIWGSVGSVYYPINEEMYLELSRPSKSGQEASVVNIRTRERVGVIEAKPGESLFYLPKETSMTNP
jgi:hypothetical protein